VSLTGSDAAPGTLARPFRTIARGISVVQAGDVLSLRGGVYVESVRIAGKHGTAWRPIIIRSYPGERAFIDGSLPQFRALNNDDWEPVPADVDDVVPPHSDEYVSKIRVTGFVRGVFLDRQPYTRLISYSTLEDLRATNETFDRISGKDSRPGPQVVDCDDDGSNCLPATFRYPWVYMGPGIWVDRSVSPETPQPIHIRLSHTHNNVPGLADYRGKTDPRQIRIAIATESMQTLRITDTSYVRFENLDIRYGGDVTAFIATTTGLVFDHVRFSASTYGVRTRDNQHLTFQHCDFDGGKPSWYFRNDGKKEYWFLRGSTPLRNSLGKQTMRSLFVPSRLDNRTIIRQCEFHDAHDLYLGGNDVDFHHNWVRNLNDEGLFLDAYGRNNVRVHHNVILKTLSAFSFAGEAVGDVTAVGGPFYIYRNLVDLREPTAGYRPKRVGDVDVWRYGSAFKSNGADGPYALFQNTFLVYGQDGQASYLHFRNLRGTHVRRAFNNIFVAVDPDAASDRAITIIPSPVFHAQTDGNVYHRIGSPTSPPYRSLPYSSEQGSGPAAYFDCLTGCPNALVGSALFEASKVQYAPGYEANSIESDPQFQQISADGKSQKADDLRLRSTSPALGSGILLFGDRGDLGAMDGPVPAHAPDIGCYRLGSDPLHVGIDGRRSYPASQ